MDLEFYNQNGKVDHNLFDAKAQEIARTLVKKDGRNTNGVSRHQLRRIFDEVKRLKKILDEKDNWDDIYPLIKLIKSKVAYSTARAKKNDKWSKDYYTNLSSFIKTSIDKVKIQKDYEIFCLLFEAVYGFYYELGGSETK